MRQIEIKQNYRKQETLLQSIKVLTIMQTVKENQRMK